jgi:prolyl 4-hydroxylase
LKQTVRPKKGTAVLWPTVRNSNPTDVDLRTDYEIEDVKRGTVYGVTTWLHLHEYDIGCAWICVIIVDTVRDFSNSSM